MVKTLKVHGMHCMSCVSKIEKAFYVKGGFTRVEANYESGTLILDAPILPNEDMISKVLSSAGEYNLVSGNESATEPKKVSFWVTYKPLLLIAFFLILVSSIAAMAGNGWDNRVWMHVFMGGFFLVFSFFKLLDVKGFASAFQSYDLVAGIWPRYGRLYPYLELLLGVAYLLFLDAVAVNTLTIVLMGVGGLGVANSLRKNSRSSALVLEQFSIFR